MRKTRRLARWIGKRFRIRSGKRCQRQGTSTVEKASKWVEEQYRNAKLVADAASYRRHPAPHDFGRQQ